MIKDKRQILGIVDDLAGTQLCRLRQYVADCTNGLRAQHNACLTIQQEPKLSASQGRLERPSHTGLSNSPHTLRYCGSHDDMKKSPNGHTSRFYAPWFLDRALDENKAHIRYYR